MADLSKIWETFISQNVHPGEKYYHNEATKTTQWDVPEGEGVIILPVGWFPEDEDGKVVYYYRDSGKKVTNIPTNSTPTKNTSPGANEDAPFANEPENVQAHAANVPEAPPANANNQNKNKKKPAGATGNSAAANNLVKKIKEIEKSVTAMAAEAKESIGNIQKKTGNSVGKVGTNASSGAAAIAESATNIANGAKAILAAATGSTKPAAGVVIGSSEVGLSPGQPDMLTGHVAEGAQEGGRRRKARKTRHGRKGRRASSRRARK